MDGRSSVGEHLLNGLRQPAHGSPCSGEPHAARRTVEDDGRVAIGRAAYESLEAARPGRNHVSAATVSERELH